MSREIIQALEKYGLSKFESMVYLALVKRLEANITDIAKDISLPRATVYKVLDSLEKKKLVSKLMKNKVRHYTLTNLKQLDKNLLEKREALENILPDLRQLIFTAQKDSSVKILTGKGGLYLMWEDIIESFKKSSCKDNYAIAGLGARNFQPRYFPQWKRRQKALGIKPKIIYPESVRLLHSNNSSHIDQRYIPDDIIFTGAINLYAGQKVAIASFDKKKPHAVIIHSPEIYQLFLMVWKFMWTNALD